MVRSRFELEATVAAGIESEHIVETTDAGVDPETGSPFLVMELLKGEDLGAVLERRGALPPAEIVTLLGQVALALERTHAAGIVHRDLKPENLFLTRRDDGSPRVKILDFGIAKIVAQDARTGAQTQAIGTPVYMSPEQLAGDGTIGPRSDLYAVAHIAYTLLTGSPYWHDEMAEHGSLYPVLVKIMQGATAPASERAARRGVTLPAAFDAWFARATAVAPAARYAHAVELVAALAEAVGVDAPRLSVVMDGVAPVADVGRPAAPGARDGDDGTRAPVGASSASVDRPHTTAAVASELPAGVPGKSRVPWVAVAVVAVVIAGAGITTRALSTGARAPGAASAPVASAASTSAPLPSSAPAPVVAPVDAPAAPPSASASAAPRATTPKSPAPTPKAASPAPRGATTPTPKPASFD
jgi:serine/threonine-protein kinase